MVTIGDKPLAGVSANIESAASAGRSVGSPGTPIFVGQADLANGSASANSVVRIGRPRQARVEFGDPDNSMLAQAVRDSLIAGAYPAYAVAPENVTTTEDWSAESGATGTLSNTPVVEDADRITANVNSSDKTITFYRDGDPQNATPDTDEVLINPQTGSFNSGEDLGNTGDQIEYDYADYSQTFDQIDTAEVGNVKVREVIDFIGVVDEADSIVSDAVTKAESMATNDWYSIVIAGAGSPAITDLSSYSNPHDTSRAQLVYPSRKGDTSETAIGAYVGVRSAIGIDSIPIHSRINTITDMQFGLSRSDREDLINNFVNPLEERGSGVRIGEDLTTVSDDNTDESAWRRGYARLVTDFVTESIIEISDPYIGEFNNTQTLNSLSTSISSALDPLLESNQIEAYSLVLESTSSVEAAVDVGINAASPLRNIELNVSAGDVAGGSRIQGE